MDVTKLEERTLNPDYFGIEVFGNGQPTNVSEMLLNASNFDRTKEELQRYGFLVVRRDKLETKKGKYYLTVRDYSTIGTNVRKVHFIYESYDSRNKNLLWHKDLDLVGAIMLHYPLDAEEDSNMELTGLGKEEVVVPIVAKSLDKLVHIFQEELGITIDEALKSQDVPGHIHQASYIIEVLRDYSPNQRAKFTRKIGKILASAIFSLSKLYDTYDILNREEQRKVVAIASRVLVPYQNFECIDRFFKELDLGVGQKVYRHSWKPGDSLLVYNQGDVLHTRIPKSDTLSLSPLYRFEVYW